VSPIEPAPFRRIASDFRDAIRRGTYAPGDQLPTAGEIARRYGVARSTAQHAIDLLRADGLIVTWQGRPPAVSREVKGRRRRLSRKRYGRARVEQARLTPAPQEITYAGRQPAPQLIADIFRLPSAELMVTRRRIVYGSRGPVELGESWLRLDEFGGTELEEPTLLSPSLFAVAERISGRTYARARELWTAELATEEQARALRVPPRSPILHVVHIAMDRRRAPIEVSQSWWPGDAIVLEDEFRVDRAVVPDDVSDL
jgi:GntR family transcriptional regulator